MSKPDMVVDILLALVVTTRTPRTATGLARAVRNKLIVLSATIRNTIHIVDSAAVHAS